MGHPLAAATNVAEITLGDERSRIVDATVRLTILRPTATIARLAVLQGGIDAVAGQVQVLHGQGLRLPTPPYYLFVDGTVPGDAPEWLRITDYAGDSDRLVITRAALQASAYPAVAHPPGAIATLRSLTETASALDVPHVSNGVYRLALPPTAVPVAADGYEAHWDITVPAPRSYTASLRTVFTATTA